jgi:hypothetical protein
MQIFTLLAILRNPRILLWLAGEMIGAGRFICNENSEDVLLFLDLCACSVLARSLTGLGRVPNGGQRPSGKKSACRATLLAMAALPDRLWDDGVGPGKRGMGKVAEDEYIHPDAERRY